MFDVDTTVNNNAGLYGRSDDDSLDQLEFFDFLKFTENLELSVIWCFNTGENNKIRTLGPQKG